MLLINDFTNDFTSPLPLKLQEKLSKRVFLLGDFNIDLLKYEMSDTVNNFIDTLYYLTFYYLLYFYPQGFLKHPL